MDDDKFTSNFLSRYFADHNENLNEVIASLKRGRSSYVVHVARLINKINESIKSPENYLIVKCMKDQWALILESYVTEKQEFKFQSNYFSRLHKDSVHSELVQ